MDEREALLKYALRPPIAQERVVQGAEGSCAHRAEEALLGWTFFAVGLDLL
jgi:hypothetical protein